MFYCDKCRIENNMPQSISKSTGMCEICHSLAQCYDVPSARFSPSKIDAITGSNIESPINEVSTKLSVEVISSGESAIIILGKKYYEESYVLEMLQRKYDKGLSDGQKKPVVHLAVPMPMDPLEGFDWFCCEPCGPGSPGAQMILNHATGFIPNQFDVVVFENGVQAIVSNKPSHINCAQIKVIPDKVNECIPQIKEGDKIRFMPMLMEK